MEPIKSSQTIQCEKNLEKAFQLKAISHLIDSIEELGCKIPPNFFRCRSCPDNISGGFALENQPISSASSSQENNTKTNISSSSANKNNNNNCISSSSSSPSSTIKVPHVVLCDNQGQEIETFQNTIIHELVHAYDICRVENFDASNTAYHACTEIRASALSGECSILHEIYRAKFQLRNGHYDC